MANRSAILSIRVVSDSKDAQQGMKRTETGVQRLESGLNKMTVPAGIAVAALGKVSKSAIDSASALQQSTGGVEAVFGKHAAEVQKMAQNAAQNVGLATSQYQDMATVIGAQLKNMGVPMDQVAGQTDELVNLGADLAATFGGSTADAVSALSSLLKGERDPIERYGVAMNQAAIDAQKAAMGLDDLKGEADKQATTQATLALLMEQTADAQGQYAREADTAAGAESRAAAAAEDMQAQLGQKLLPLYTRAVEALSQVVDWTTQHSDAVLAAGTAVGGLAVGVLALNAALKVYRATVIAVTAVTKVWRLAQIALNTAMRLNPIGLIITIIGALIAVVVHLWRENEGFRNFFIKAWKGIQLVAQVVWRAIKQAVVTVVGSITRRVRAFGEFVVNLWNATRAAAVLVWRAIGRVVRAFGEAAGRALRRVREVGQNMLTGLSNAVRRFRDAGSKAFQAARDVGVRALQRLRDIGKAALDVLLNPIEFISDAFSSLWQSINDVISALGRIRFPSPPSWMRSIGSVFSFSAPLASDDGALTARTMDAEAATTQQLVAPAPYAAASGGSGLVADRTGDTITINIAGAIDPVGTARQIERVVGKNMRRTGRRSIGQVTFA